MFSLGVITICSIAPSVMMEYVMIEYVVIKSHNTTHDNRKLKHLAYFQFPVSTIILVEKSVRNLSYANYET